jgi:cyclic pyranopterin phosphate synthase
MNNAKLTHIDENGASRMVDVSEKDVTERIAVAHARVTMKPETFSLIMDKKITKGDVLGVARVAGIMAAKKTSELVPMCHPLNLNSVKIDYEDNNQDSIEITSEVKVSGKTGVEMEALTAVSICALTIYDMCKSADRSMLISDVYLVKKSGGKSGNFVRKT